MRVSIESGLDGYRTPIIYFDEKEQEIFARTDLQVPLKTSRVILKDINGMEYISIPNIYGFPDTSRTSFDYRIHDAIHAVVNGIGDKIEMDTAKYPFKNRVIYFIDREYGDKVKAEEIQRLKTLHPCFSIMICDDRRLSDEIKFLCHKDLYLYGITVSECRLQYDSEKEANFLIATLNESMREISELKHKKDIGEITDTEYRSLTFQYPMILKYLNRDHVSFKPIQDLKRRVCIK